MYEFGSTICYRYSPVSMQKKKKKKKIEKKKKTYDCKFIKHIKSHFETADQIFFFLLSLPILSVIIYFILKFLGVTLFAINY